MSDTHFATWPVAAYGTVLLLAAVAWQILSRVLLLEHGRASALALAVRAGTKEKISVALYAAALAAAFWHAWIACALYALVAAFWLIPDPRIERTITPRPR
jgi:uncharacterized membrane protein